MTDYNKLKVEVIKQMLIDEGTFTEKQLEQMNIKGKTQWVNLYKMFNTEEQMKENEEKYQFDETQDPIPPPKIEGLIPNSPTYNSPEWHDHVMSQLSQGELIEVGGKKYPNVNGLRRMAGLLLGNITSAGPIEIKTTMDPNLSGKSVVTYEVVIEWKLDGYIANIDGEAIYPTRTFRATASSWTGNTDDMYAVFPETIAETRAEGRALRRALRLGVVCADELTRKNTAEVIQQQQEKTEGNWDESASISDAQINTIQILCNRLNIDVGKFINSGSKQYGDITEISRKAASIMIKKLNEYQNTNNNSVSVPIEFLKEK